MNRDDSFALLVSLGVHALLLLLFFTVALDSRAELEPPAPRMVEIEFAPTPIPVQPVFAGPSQRAEAGERSPARQQLEPERPAPPASSPVRPPERPRQTPPRESPPLPRSSQTPDATPTRPSPPTRQTNPEPNPTPPRQEEPTTGSGAGGGESSSDGRADSGGQTGSGGENAYEYNLAGGRGWDCNEESIPPAPQGGGSLSYVLTFSPSGQLVSARATRRNTILDNHIKRYLRCTAERVPGSIGNKSTSATFTIR